MAENGEGVVVGGRVAGPSMMAAVIAVICVAAGLQAAPGKASANVVPGYAVIDLTPIRRTATSSDKLSG